MPADVLAHDSTEHESAVMQDLGILWVTHKTLHIERPPLQGEACMLREYVQIQTIPVEFVGRRIRIELGMWNHR